LSPESDRQRAKGGALISARPPPILFRNSKNTDLLIDGREDKRSDDVTTNWMIIYRDMTTRERQFDMKKGVIRNRNTLACMKRVYGGAFSGYVDSHTAVEGDIIDSLVRASETCRFNYTKTIASQSRKLRWAAVEIVSLVKRLYEQETDKYLQRVSNILADPKTNISWGPVNNCQKFVDQLLQGKDFEYIFPRLPKGFGEQSSRDVWKGISWPRYLISFGDRIEGDWRSLRQPNSIVGKFIQNKYVQGDLIEFLELRMLQTQKHKKRNQDNMFESLEELVLVTPKLGSTSSSAAVMEALWELPRDTLSILQFHLLRTPQRYCTTTGQSLTHKQWMESRLRLFQQLDVFSALTGAFGSALLSLFSRKPDLIAKVTIPKSRVYGSARADEKVRILRLSPVNIIYVVSRLNSVIHPLFEAPDDLFTEKLLEFVEKAGLKGKHQSQVLLIRRLSYIFKAYIKSVSLMSPIFVNWPVVISGAITASKDIVHKDGWISIDFGDLIFVQQVFAKSKNVR
jgi:hypothetical protein